MIRVVLIGNPSVRLRSLAASLSEDERLDVVDVWPHPGRPFAAAGMVDVIVTVGVLLDQIPAASAPPVVALTNEPLDDMPLRHGIRAVLPLSSSDAEISAAIIAAANDLLVITQRQASDWLSSTPTRQFDNREREALTDRELQVLRMLADGLANKEIADQLGISEHTAKFHVAQILAKLRAVSRAEAVAIGMRRGLVPV